MTGFAAAVICTFAVSAAPSASTPKHFPEFLERLKKLWMTQPKMGKEQLAKISCPVLVIAGDHDMVEPKETLEIFQSIAGAQQWVVPNSTHFVPKDRSKLFNETVDAFFKEPVTPKKN